MQRNNGWIDHRNKNQSVDYVIQTFLNFSGLRPTYFLKKLLKCHFIKAQRVGYFRNGPGAVPQQHFRFLHNALRDHLSCGLACSFFHCAIEVIDMNVQLRRKIRRRSQLHGLVGVVNWELSLQQLKKQR